MSKISKRESRFQFVPLSYLMIWATPTLPFSSSKRHQYNCLESKYKQKELVIHLIYNGRINKCQRDSRTVRFASFTQSCLHCCFFTLFLLLSISWRLRSLPQMRFPRKDIVKRRSSNMKGFRESFRLMFKKNIMNLSLLLKVKIGTFQINNSWINLDKLKEISFASAMLIRRISKSRIVLEKT